VYTRSALFEQTTAAAFAIEDNHALALGVTFVDQDLDAMDVGGTVTWGTPNDANMVDHYAVYFAADAMGSIDL
jgi:hypothetical protein